MTISPIVRYLHTWLVLVHEDHYHVDTHNKRGKPIRTKSIIVYNTELLLDALIDVDICVLHCVAINVIVNPSE